MCERRDALTQLKSGNGHLPNDPRDVIAEVLGQPATKGLDPAARDFHCPYMGRRCTKSPTGENSEPYPLCTLYHGPDRRPVCVCPNRFHEIDFLSEVTRLCWPEQEQPANPEIVREVKMKGFGNVDFVIADVGENRRVKQFLSVELQAIDISGSARPAYNALLQGEDFEWPRNSKNQIKRYGFNWANVYKRYVTQLIRKGYFHHHWGTKIVAVIQDEVYQYIKNWADFMRSPDLHGPQTNIIFLSYGYDRQPDGSFRMSLREAEGTSHASLQQAVLYKEALPRSDFTEQIERKLGV